MNAVEKRLNRAIKKITPDVLEKILDSYEKEKGAAEMTSIGYAAELPKARISANLGKWAAIATSLILAAFGSYFGYGYYLVNYTVDSVIEIDVNPSIEIKVNQSEKVLSAGANNKEGEDVLEGMDLKGVDLDVAVNALVGSMLRHGYVDEIKNSLLISVESSNLEKGAALQTRLSGEVTSILDSYSVKGAVLSQTILDDERLAALAKDYGISLGKAAIIDLMVSQDPRLEFADMAKLSINDINLIISSREMTAQSIALSGSASSVGYIGEDNAKSAALAHAAINSSDAQFVKAKLDWEDGKMIYEVVFFTSEAEYDYEIDALSAQVLSYDKDALFRASQSYGENSKSFITEEQAKSAALTHAGLNESSVSFVKVKLDFDNGRNIYDIEFYSGNAEYDYEIDALSGEILEYGQDANNYPAIAIPKASPSETPEVQTNSYIGEAEAKNIALSHAGVSETSLRGLSVSLDMDHGRAAYEVEFKNGRIEYEYEIDASSGEILEWDSDYDD
ncbi:MAG: PepSY domain-containing protein [Clostridiales bacterium]|jgi:uncharacterized membrane protein YkoI|nr:PepSY domain-containing protein [Clostridiales bacterium]